MPENQSPDNIRSGFKEEDMSPHQRRKFPLVVEQGQTLPSNVMRLLQGWHERCGREKPPCGSNTSKAASHPRADGRTYKFFPRHNQPLEPLQKIEIISPSRYVVYCLTASDGTGMLVKFVRMGNCSYLKRWNGEKYEEEPVAVRLTGTGDDWPEFPDECEWEKYKKMRMPSERSAEKAREERSSKRERRGLISHQNITKRPRRTRQPTDTTSDDSSEDDEDEDEDESEENQAAPVGLSNGGRPSFSRSTAFVPRSSSMQRPSNKNSPSQQSLLDLSIARSPFANVHSTASNSASTLETTITFNCTVPRTTRTLRAKNNEDNPACIYNKALEFFRRYDSRALGAPILECVIDGEMDRTCIYDAEELSDYIADLRERRGVVKVTVTRTF